MDACLGVELLSPATILLRSQFRRGNLPGADACVPGSPAGSRRRRPALRGGHRPALARTLSGFTANILLLWPRFGLLFALLHPRRVRS